MPSQTEEHYDLPRASTRFCFYCWHGSCESCNYGSCDCWCCPKATIGPPQFPRADEYLCLPSREPARA